MTTSAAILCLALGSYGLRAAGLHLPRSRVVDKLAGPVTAAILASLIISSTITDGTALTIDSRLVGLAAALTAIAARRNLITVLVVSVAATVATRLIL